MGVFLHAWGTHSGEARERGLKRGLEGWFSTLDKVEMSKKIWRYDFFLYFCNCIMTTYNPNMTLHKLFLNIKKRDICIL